MSLEEERVNQNEWVRWLLNKDHNAELWKILAFWEKYKKEWEEMRMKFWRRWDSDKYVNLIMQYKDSKEVYMDNLSGEEKDVIDRFDGVWKDKFIEEYMHDKVLYRGDKDKEMEKKKYRYDDWKAWKVIMEEWVYLSFGDNKIWDEWAVAISKMKLKKWVLLDLCWNKIWEEWAEALSKMELKEWVTLNLYGNEIWDAWAEAISKMELKEWVELSLYENDIWDEWAEAISKMELKEWVMLSLWGNNIWAVWAKEISKMKLKEWVWLDLAGNDIWDEWVEAIMKNMELKDWVVLFLMRNNISKEMKDQLSEWIQWYKDNWINCKVVLD